MFAGKRWCIGRRCLLEHGRLVGQQHVLRTYVHTEPAGDDGRGRGREQQTDDHTVPAQVPSVPDGFPGVHRSSDQEQYCRFGGVPDVPAVVPQQAEPPAAHADAFRAETAPVHLLQPVVPQIVAPAEAPPDPHGRAAVHVHRMSQELLQVGQAEVSHHATARRHGPSSGAKAER